MNNTTLEQPIGEDGGMSMGLGARAVWDSLFVAMIVVAIVGNLIVLWIILGKEGSNMSILFALNNFTAQSTNTIRVTIKESTYINYIKWHQLRCEVNYSKNPPTPIIIHSEVDVLCVLFLDHVRWSRVEN